MSAANSNSKRFSADVRMHLRVNGHVHSIGQLGPDFVMLDDTTDQPPGEAVITLSIDGCEKQWIVQLPNGIRAGELKTLIIRRSTGSRAPVE
jgi:hypothetical protein